MVRLLFPKLTGGRFLHIVFCKEPGLLLLNLPLLHRLQEFWHTGLLLCGMWDLGSQARDPTCIPCIARWVLNHWTIREVPSF